MRKELLCSLLLFALLVSCQKENTLTASDQNLSEEKLSGKKPDLSDPKFNLNVTLRGVGAGGNEDAPVGHLKFRQDKNAEKIIDLEIKLHNMLPNHEYLLQRAVDPINSVDGICTSTMWLTLGKGLTPQSIITSNEGNGREELWRDVSAIPSGSAFDIHFQIIDATTNQIVLSSDCLQYQVR